MGPRFHCLAFARQIGKPSPMATAGGESKNGGGLSPTIPPDHIQIRDSSSGMRVIGGVRTDRIPRYRPWLLVEEL